MEWHVNSSKMPSLMWIYGCTQTSRCVTAFETDMRLELGLLNVQSRPENVIRKLCLKFIKIVWPGATRFLSDLYIFARCDTFKSLSNSRCRPDLATEQYHLKTHLLLATLASAPTFRCEPAVCAHARECHCYFGTERNTRLQTEATTGMTNARILHRSRM